MACLAPQYTICLAAKYVRRRILIYQIDHRDKTCELIRFITQDRHVDCSSQQLIYHEDLTVRLRITESWKVTVL